VAQSKWLKGDVVSGAVLAALGVYVVSEAWRWDYSTAEGPGPGFFPLWYGMAMIVLSLVLAAGSALSGTEGKAMDWGGVRRALTAWAVFASAVALLKFTGFIIALALLTLFVVAVMYGRPLKVAIAAAVGNAAGFYLVFGLALQLNLPAGPLGF
jgi:putative tricarboxylic transport membrane protein